MPRLTFFAMCCLGTVLALSVSSRAEEPDPARLLTDFEKLGFPDVRQARYVKLDYVRNLDVESLFRYDEESSGNAWLLSETAASNGLSAHMRVVVNGVLEVNLGGKPIQPWRDYQGLAQQVLFEEDEAPRTDGWRLARPEADVLKAERFFKELESGKLSRFYLEDGTEFRIFFFALALQQRGDTDGARRVLTGLYRLRGKVIETRAVGYLADNLYRSLYDRFRETGDGAVYCEGMKGLLVRFPRLPAPQKDPWENRSVVEEILARTEAALKGDAPLPAPDAAFTDTGRNLAQEFQKVRRLNVTSRYTYEKPLWLAPASWTNTIPPGTDPDLRIRALGLEAIPLLLALVEDKAYTRAPFIEPDFIDSFSRRKELPRLMTRGEAALLILKDIMPEYLGEEAKEKNTPFPNACRKFYERNKAKSGEEVAGLFLREENYMTAREQAMEFLLRRASTANVPVLETFFLEGPATPGRYRGLDRPALLDRAEEMARYGAIRGGAVRPLALKMADRLEREARDYKKPENVSYGNPESDRKAVEGARDSLRNAATVLRTFKWETGTSDLAAQWVGESDIAARNWVERVLDARLEIMPPPDALRLLMACAVKETDPERRMKMAILINQSMMEERRRLTPASTAEEWKALFGDSRTNREHQVRDSYLILCENLFAPPEASAEERYIPFYGCPEENPCSLGMPNRSSRALDLIHLYGDEGRAFLLKREIARLEGVPEESLEPFPSARTFPVERVASVESRLEQAKTREEAEAVAAALGLPEREGLPALLTNHPALNARLVPLSMLVKEVVVEGDDALRRELAELVGQPAGTGLVHRLKAYCESRTRAGKSVTVSLERLPRFGGCIVKAVPFVPTAEKPGEPGEKMGIVGYSGLSVIFGSYGFCDWRIRSVPSRQHWDAFLTSGPDERHDFEKALNDEFFSAIPAASSAGLVMFQTQWRNE